MAAGEPSVSLPAGTHIGKYVVQRKLAEGGMAEIFLASSFGPEGFEKQVIIKRIRPAFADDASFIDMFVSEARLVSRLNHANIVQIFDCDRHENTFYIAMEYIRGKSLAQAHQRARELSVPLVPALAAQIVSEVARGLNFAHRLTERGQPLGLVHRDVTPQNILLSYEGAVKLTDFGIAKAGSRASTVGMLKGKFAYMSPEQSRGEPVDARTDIFALGITFWELLTGGRLFDGDSDIAVLRAVQERNVLPPEQLNPAVDSALNSLVMQCLERDRKDRFQNAQELERAINRYLNTATAQPEDTDVGAWMRELFPIEAARTENTEFRPVPLIPGRQGGDTLASTPGAELRRLSGSGTMPPDLLTGEGEEMSPALGSSRSRALSGAKRENSAYTPVASAHEVASESATRRKELPKWATKPMLLVALTAVGSTVLAIVLAVMVGTKSEPKARTVPQEAPSQRPAEPVKPADLVLAPAQPVQALPDSPTPAPRDPAPPVAAPVASPGRGTVPAPVHTHKSGSSPKGAPGKLVLTVNPWGQVFIDGKLRGEQVGRSEYELPPGSHQVEVKGPSSWGPKQIEILSKQTASQAVSLK
jgi:eukaryotic-like serine/threonine-protein kinase